MKCPFCNHMEDKVIDSREGKEGESIRRRMQCLGCEKRFTTYERIDEVPYMVIKKDGRREKFDRQKVLNGLMRACEKRPVSDAHMEEIVASLERQLFARGENEVQSSLVGEKLMEALKTVDPVAYIRFASVYRSFRDVESFQAELADLLSK